MNTINKYNNKEIFIHFYILPMECQLEKITCAFNSIIIISIGLKLKF